MNHPLDIYFFQCAASFCLRVRTLLLYCCNQNILELCCLNLHIINHIQEINNFFRYCILSSGVRHNYWLYELWVLKYMIYHTFQEVFFDI